MYRAVLPRAAPLLGGLRRGPRATATEAEALDAPVASVGGAASSRGARRPGKAGPAFDFAELDQGPGVPADTATWAGLRTAAEWALRQGKLDTYLWWRYASDAKQRLAGNTRHGAAEASDAAGVVTACARARVEESTGLYAAWARALVQARAGGSAVVPAGRLAAAAQAFARARAQTEDAHFWQEWLPQAFLEASHAASSRDLADVAAAYAWAGLGGSQMLSAVKLVAMADEARWLGAGPSDAARLLWAHQRCGRLSVALLRCLWAPALDGHLSELSAAHFAAVAGYAAALRPRARSQGVSEQLVGALQRRASSSTFPPALLCHAAHALSEGGLAGPADLWVVAEGAAPHLRELPLLSLAKLLAALGHQSVRDPPLIAAAASEVAERTAEQASVEDMVEGSVAHGEDEGTDMRRLADPPDERRGLLLALDSAAMLPELAATDAGRSIASLAASALSQVAEASALELARAALAFEALGSRAEADRLADALSPAATGSRANLCEALRLGDSSDQEELLRLLTALPRPPDALLVDTAVRALAAEADALSASLAASACLSLRLLDRPCPAALRQAAEPEELSTAGLLQLCLAELLGSAAAEAAAAPDAPPVALDWPWVLRLLEELSARGGLQSAGGPEGLLLQALEALHARPGAGERPPWPAQLQVAASGFRYAGPPGPHDVASPCEARRLRACLHVLLQESAECAAASAPSLELLRRCLSRALQS